MNLPELNLLAQKLSGLDERRQKLFENMVETDRNNLAIATNPLPRLINLAFNIENRLELPDIFTDELLGRCLYENDMLSQENRDMVEKIKNSANSDSHAFFQILGFVRRISENGAYTPKGYIENARIIKEICKPGEMVYFDCSGAPVVLKISKGFFNDPDYGNDLSAVLNLPEVYGNEISKDTFCQGVFSRMFIFVIL